VSGVGCQVSAIKNHKYQITNTKWFDKLTTLSQVEGQITMTEIQNSKQLTFDLICNLAPVICYFSPSRRPVHPG
jgi:hypothetical protein